MKSTIFGKMTDNQKKQLMRQGKTIEISETRPLFHQGDPGRHYYIIQKGTVIISITSHDGREIILNKLAQGDAFGEVAMFDQGVRTADAFAKRGTVLHAIERDQFFAFLSENAALYQSAIETLCARVRWCSALTEDFLFHDTMSRVILAILKAVRKTGMPRDSLIELTQDELSKMAGASREAVNRNLQLLQDKGLVFLQRKRMVVPDPERLEAIVAKRKTK